MQRLIDANKLIAKWKPVVKRYEGDSKYWEIAYILGGVIEDVENEPTVDPIPVVVLCKDCKKWETINCPFARDFVKWDGFKFCAWEKQKKMLKDLFRKKGHWKDAKMKWVQKGTGIELELKYRCSRCGLFNLWDTPYCPFCGVKMDKGEENE